MARRTILAALACLTLAGCGESLEEQVWMGCRRTADWRWDASQGCTCFTNYVMSGLNGDQQAAIVNLFRTGKDLDFIVRYMKAGTLPLSTHPEAEPRGVTITPDQFQRMAEEYMPRCATKFLLEARPQRSTARSNLDGFGGQGGWADSSLGKERRPAVGARGGFDREAATIKE